MKGGLFTFAFLVIIAVSYARYVDWPTWDDINVQLTCLQGLPTDIRCQFFFTNNGIKDQYLLKRNTPLEGFVSNFLSVTQEGGRSLRYKGPHIHRLPPTEEDYILIPAGDTVSSPSIEINRAYKFPHDGIYTIQYTGPLVYYSMDKAPHQKVPEWAVANVMVTGTSQDKDIWNDELELGRSNMDEIHAFAKPKSCPDATFSGTPKKPGSPADTLQLHKQMCATNGLPKSLDYVTSKKKKIYQTWFGAVDPTREKTVKRVLESMLLGLQAQSNNYYVFGDGISKFKYCSTDPKTIAYWDPNEPTTIHLCPRYEDLQKSSSTDLHTKRQTLAHEWSHAFGGTEDFLDPQGDSSAKWCKNMAKNKPDEAVDNADNYGFYYSNVFRI